MPTAARVVAALLIALVGFLSAEQVKTVLPEGMYQGYLSEITTLIGVLIGWSFLGSRAGRGWVAGINNGITAGVMLVVVALFFFGADHMIGDAMKRRFDTPVEATADVFLNMFEFSKYLLNQSVLVTLIGGSLIAGLLTEMAGRAWR